MRCSHNALTKHDARDFSCISLICKGFRDSKREVRYILPTDFLKTPSRQAVSCCTAIHGGAKNQVENCGDFYRKCLRFTCAAW